MSKCKYCEKWLVNNSNRIWFDDMAGIEHPNTLVYITCKKDVNFNYWELAIEQGEYGDSIQINYCPMCGRKLSEVATR